MSSTVKTIFGTEVDGQEGNVHSKWLAQGNKCNQQKKTNYKGQKVTKPQPVFLYNWYMSGVDLIDQFFTVLQFSV